MRKGALTRRLEWLSGRSESVADADDLTSTNDRSYTCGAVLGSLDFTSVSTMCAVLRQLHAALLLP